MKRLIQIAVAVLLMVLVLAVFISPAVNLPKTALGSQQSLLIMIGMMLAACGVLLAKGGTHPMPYSLLEQTTHRTALFRLSTRTNVLLC